MADTHVYEFTVSSEQGFRITLVSTGGPIPIKIQHLTRVKIGSEQLQEIIIKGDPGDVLYRVARRGLPVQYSLWNYTRAYFDNVEVHNSWVTVVDLSATEKLLRLQSTTGAILQLALYIE